MQTSKLADWLQIMGNFGIVAGLILVGFQIKQNSDIAHAQIVSDGFALASNTRLALAGEEPGTILAKSLTAPRELTHEEIVKLNAYLGAYWYTRVRTEYLGQSGFSSLTPEEYGESVVFEFLDTPFGAAWWKESADGFGASAPRTRQAIEDTLRNLPNYHVGEKARIERIQAHLAELSPD